MHRKSKIAAFVACFLLPAVVIGAAFAQDPLGSGPGPRGGDPLAPFGSLPPDPSAPPRNTVESRTTQIIRTRTDCGGFTGPGGCNPWTIGVKITYD